MVKRRGRRAREGEAPAEPREGEARAGGGGSCRADFLVHPSHLCRRYRSPSRLRPVPLGGADAGHKDPNQLIRLAQQVC
jgi:hypothetical protein